MLNLADLTSDTPLSKLAASVAVIALAIIVQIAIRQTVPRLLARRDVRRQWIVSLRNAIVLLAFIGLAAIWIDELRAFAAALVAFAVAVVIATREFILCINGSLLRTATNAYSVGDRIAIGGHRGDVIDVTLFTTTLLEVGPGEQYHLRTGRTIVVPNSRLLDSYLINESSMKPYVLHVFSVPVVGDWERAERILLEAANEESAPFLEEVRQHMKRLEDLHSLNGLPVQPRVNLQLLEDDKIILLVRTPSRIGDQGRLEQAIIRKYLKRLPVEGASDLAPQST